MQLGTNEEEATETKEHAVPRGLCENFINALKLLANQQRDGDSPIQNIVSGLLEKVGNVSRTIWEATLPRTIIVPWRWATYARASDIQDVKGEEVDTLRACINVDHIGATFWGPPLVDADWHAFCHAMCEGIGGSEWDQKAE